MQEYRPMDAGEQARALSALHTRRGAEVTHIDNASLYAGSKMYHYCRMCRHLCDELNELHTERPRQHCNECERLIAAGWDDTQGRFIKYRIERCGSCNGSGRIGSRRRSFGRSYWHEYGCSRCDGTGRIKILEE